MTTPESASPLNPPAVAATSTKCDKAVPSKPAHVDTARDHFESILFALVLALLFRTFEAEAFVIPTGSMAPTLYGRHKESTCIHCGHRITIGASDELNAESGLLYDNVRIESAICPNCRGVTEVRDALAFNGDRILVNKYPYELGDPSRWDVFVFKYPEEPHINYIKRLVGLPGETIRVRQGNLYLWDGKEEKILRKDDVNKQKVLQIPVYDDRFAPTELLRTGWPERWAAVKKTDGNEGVAGWTPEESTWTQDPQQRVFDVKGAQAPGLNWIRYRNYTPKIAEWQLAEQGEKQDPVPRLVTDFCGYNTYSGSGGDHIEAMAVEQIDTGEFWVGDLTLSCELNITAVGDSPQVVLELVEGEFQYQCRIDCKTATAVLFKITPDREIELASSACGINGPGSYHLRFANVDDRLVLWIDDEVIEFGQAAILDQPNALSRPLPTAQDLTPVGIAAQGLDATVSQLLIERDIYYRADLTEHDFRRTDQGRFRRDLARYLDRPDDWSRRYLQEQEMDSVEIKVTDDGYLALGDNSPRSRDSRLWSPALQSVPRKFLVGKAFYIYWPHGVPFLNNGRGYTLVKHRDSRGRVVEDYPKYTAPFYPQIDRMRRIR